MPERKSPPFIPKKHRDGAEIAAKCEGGGTQRRGFKFSIVSFQFRGRRTQEHSPFGSQGKQE